MKSFTIIVCLVLSAMLFASGCSDDEYGATIVRDGKKLSYKAALYCSPTPFSTDAVISFELLAGQRVRLSIYSQDWVEIKRISDAQFAAGSHIVPFVASDLANGNYFIVGQLEGETAVLPVICAK